MEPEHCALLCIGSAASEGLSTFTKLTEASVEALRYRGEDVEKSLTKNTVKEVRTGLCCFALRLCIFELV